MRVHDLNTYKKLKIRNTEVHGASTKKTYFKGHILLTISGQIPRSEKGISGCGTINPHTLKTK